MFHRNPLRMTFKNAFNSLLFAIVAFVGMSASAQAQITSPGSLWDFFGTTTGDAYSAVFLNQIFGPLFPTEASGSSTSIFAMIIAYFNVIVLLIGGLMFFYNVTVGVMQSAHEGKVLGQRWSSLWVPLRLVFAVGMLVPVNEGYNLAQTGVAYIVKGSTNMASAVWSATATLVIDGDIPLAGPVSRLDSTLVDAMWEQASCSAALTPSINLANPSARVDYIREEFEDQITFTSAIMGGSSPSSLGVCGSWSTPSVPTYLQNIIDAAEDGEASNALMTSATAETLRRTFKEGHEQIMQDLYGSLFAVAQANYTAVSSTGIEPPSISDDIASAYEAANAGLVALNADIVRLATESDNGVSRAQDRILERVTGGAECSIGSIASNATENAEASTEARNCYGEGWMGAGSWYILIAKINNELSSLTSANSSANAPTYMINGMRLDPREIYRASGGQGSGIFGRVTGSDYANLPSSETMIAAIEGYENMYTSAANRLAAFGFDASTEDVMQANAESGNDFWESIIPNQTMAEGTRALVSVLDPSANGADPMIGVIWYGKWLIGIGTMILVASAASGFFTGGGAAIALLPVYSILISAGVTLAFIMPLMPFLYWILAISGYFLLIAEAIVAVNLWALSHLKMDGEGISGEAGRMGWLMMLSLFMTPTLMVFGFIIGMVLFRVSTDLVSAGLFYAVSSLMGANPIMWLFGTLGYTVLIVSTYLIFLERSFSLVSEFPNRVMRWMGSDVNIGGGENAIRTATAAAAVGMNGIGNGIEKSLGRTDNQGRFIRGSGIGGRLRNAGEKYRGRGNGTAPGITKQ